jgi:hypothetical protein
MDDTTIVLVLTIGITFTTIVLRYAFKSKCDSVSICYGLLHVHRDVEQEEKIDLEESAHLEIKL